MEDSDMVDITYFAPCKLNQGVGGSARLDNMCSALNKIGYSVHVISYFNADSFAIEREKINNLLKITIISVPKSFPRILKSIAMFPMLIYAFKEIKNTKIIFSHAPSILTGFPAIILKKLFKKPVVIDHMDAKDPQTPAFIYNYVLKNSSMVFAISNYLLNETKDIGCKNVIYLPIFIDTSFFNKNLDKRVKIREELGISAQDIVIGYAGSFSHVEGVPILLKAFKNLLDKFKNVKLVILGVDNVSGSDKVHEISKELKISDNLILLPHQPYKLMPDYLSIFDIACSPKINCKVNRAANPIKIYEYMSVGLVTVLSKVGEISEIVTDKKDAFLAKPEDYESLENILEYIIKNNDINFKVGRAAREKITKNYSEDALIMRIETALNSLGDFCGN
jgi:glycosyltransferase involved in cell wall biosynthesis